MAHYVLHEISSGELILVSDTPFKAADLKLGQAVEFFSSKKPDLNLYEWNPKYLMWRRK
jgi:hypothetical protein